MWLVTWQRLA